MFELITDQACKFDLLQDWQDIGDVPMYIAETRNSPINDGYLAGPGHPKMLDERFWILRRACNRIKINLRQCII